MKWKIGRCRSCKAEVIWARTEHDRAMPVDVAPRHDGNVMLLDRGLAVPVAVYVDLITSMEYPDADRYVSHFVTCPQAGEWRKKE